MERKGYDVFNCSAKATEFLVELAAFLAEALVFFVLVSFNSSSSISLINLFCLHSCLRVKLHIKGHLLSYLNRIVQMKVNYHVELFVARLKEGVLNVLKNHINDLILIGDVPQSVFVGI